MGSIYKINKEMDNILKEYKELDTSIQDIIHRLEKTKEITASQESKYESFNLSELFLGILFIFNTFSNIAILIYLFYTRR